MVAFLVVLYVLAAVVCGLMGRGTVLGFIGHFILSLVVTPLGDWLIQVAGRTAEPDSRDDQDVAEQ